MPEPDDVRQIFREAVINAIHARVGRAHLLAEKHFHAAPFAFAGRRRVKLVEQRIEKFPGARRLEGKTGADERQRRSLPAKNRPSTERADHLVVAQVDHPNITAGTSAVARDGQDDMGIDAGHRGVRHFKLHAGMTQFQHGLKHPGQAKFRLRIAKRRRLAKNKNPHRAGFLGLRQGNVRRFTRHLRPEKTPAEPVVLNEDFLPIG